MTVRSIPTARRAMCSNAEWEQRVHLAAALQLAEHFGWTMLVWNHISARVPDDDEAFLINPHGLLYDEITASGLARVDVDGNELTDESAVAPAGFVIHGAIYEARPDVGCVVHTHTPEGVALSCLEDGIPELCGTSAFFHDDLVYYDYEGFSDDTDERSRIASCLGRKNSMIMRNHGLTTAGGTVAEAFVRMYWLVYECRIVTHLHAMGRPYRTLPEDIAAENARLVRQGSAPGRHEWPALLRRLDRIAPYYKT